MTKLMSLVFFLSFKSGFLTKPPVICTLHCSEDECVTFNQQRVDFDTAEKACRDSNGELLTFQSETDKMLDSVNKDWFGNFWIGLRLPAGSCSNLSAPLRGYKWTSSNKDKMFIPAFIDWKSSTELCSQQCISLSAPQKWTERLCSDKTDGFLCRTNLKDACMAHTLPGSVVFKSYERCKKAPCEQLCSDVKGGFACSCFQGFIPDSSNSRQCKKHCAEERCPKVCEGNMDTSCSCPEGYIEDDNFCVDIDECAMNWCDQMCKNTFGSFECSCQEGFVLDKKDKCIKAEGSEGWVFSTPASGLATKNNLMKSSSAPAGAFLWVWVVAAVTVVITIFVIRLYYVKKQRNRDLNTIQQISSPVQNNHC
ncbi:Endosialin [Oryzias melastigma]|uniref:Thrombomodulin n=1 Tax=Oryzias melastigma TaxID=30732 RepID=A0A834F1Z4_ORYME|nr:Endosialin [Oryzias melastigma]